MARSNQACTEPLAKLQCARRSFARRPTWLYDGRDAHFVVELRTMRWWSGGYPIERQRRLQFVRAELGEEPRHAGVRPRLWIVALGPEHHHVKVLEVGTSAHLLFFQQTDLSGIRRLNDDNALVVSGTKILPLMKGRTEILAFK
jgi:hypothetical protein